MKQIQTLSPGTVPTIQQTHVTGPRGANGLSQYFSASPPSARKFEPSHSLRSAVCITLGRTFSSSLPSSAAPFIAQEFNSSNEVSYLVTSTFLLGYVPSPIFWGPGSEMYGRRAVLIPALVAYTLFYLGQTLAQNMATVLVTRFLCGFFACAPLNNCGGLLVDLWDAASRVPASSLLFASIFLGPALGPTVGGL